jgi:predicted component of type VI protein secretion system
MRVILCAAFMAMIAISGCASGVRRTDSTASAQYLAPTGTQAKSVSISLSPEAQKKAPDNLKFNQDKLLETVRRSLVASQLLNENSDRATATVDIVVTDMRARSNFTAGAFGFLAGADMLKGEVTLRDLSGKELNHFEVHADYALGGLAGGLDSTRMDWLYEKFAQLTLESLKGEKP